MSDESQSPKRKFGVDDVDAAVRTHDVVWSGTDDGTIRVEYYRYGGDVTIDLGQGDMRHTVASVTAYLDPETADEIVDALEHGRNGSWQTERCMIWVDLGWLHHDGPSKDRDGNAVSVTVSTEDGQLSIELIYEDEDEDGMVKTRTTLSDEDREMLLTALEAAIDEANSDEPYDTTSAPQSSPSRIKSGLRSAIPAGFTIVAAYASGHALHYIFDTIDMTIDGTPVSTMIPSPLSFVFVTAVLLWAVWATAYIPDLGEKPRGRRN